MRTPEIAPIAAIVMTRSTTPDKYAERLEAIAGEGWQAFPFDNRDGELTGKQIVDAGNAAGTLIGSGSMDYVAKPVSPDDMGTMHINTETNQSKELIKALIYLIIQELRGENRIDFFGICFSAQATAMAMGVVETLIEQGLDIHTINNYDDLEGFLKTEPTADPKHIVNQPGFSSPIAAVTTSEVGVLKSRVHAPNDPLFKGMTPDQIGAIHVNNQVILAEALGQIRKTFARVGGDLEILMVRDDIEIHRGRARIKAQIATGFRLGRLRAVQWHPDYTPRGLAAGLRDVVDRGVLPPNYYRPLSGGPMSMEDLIERLHAEEEPQGVRILTNFFNQVADQKNESRSGRSAQPLR